MPHCQICLYDLPQHARDCPVATGRAVQPGESYSYHAQLIARLRGQQGISDSGWYSNTPALSEIVAARLEWLEKEVHQLRSRIAKLERGGDVQPY